MKLLREPLVHFLILGLALFLLFGIVGDSKDAATDRTSGPHGAHKYDRKDQVSLQFSG